MRSIPWLLRLPWRKIDRAFVKGALLRDPSCFGCVYFPLKQFEKGAAAQSHDMEAPLRPVYCWRLNSYPC